MALCQAVYLRLCGHTMEQKEGSHEDNCGVRAAGGAGLRAFAGDGAAVDTGGRRACAAGRDGCSAERSGAERFRRGRRSGPSGGLGQPDGPASRGGGDFGAFHGGLPDWGSAERNAGRFFTGGAQGTGGCCPDVYVPEARKPKAYAGRRVRGLRLLSGVDKPGGFGTEIRR